MKKSLLHNFFGKAAMSVLAIIMMVSVVCIFDAEIAYAADEYYFTESQTGVTITDGMTAPKPTTVGKETYIFAGYYAEETCKTPVTESTDATVYKKFVPADLMSVKAQVTPGTEKDSVKTDMRLVTTVDGLNYQEVGYDVYFNGATTPVNAKTSTVYKRILATESGNTFGYDPTAFHTDAEYFTTVNLVNIANKNFDKAFFIKPYWKTLDGTKVYGMSRMARVSDSYNNIVNVPVRLYTDGTVNANTFDVAYDTTILTYVNFDNGDVYDSITATNDTGNAKVSVTTPVDVTGADGMAINLRFQVKAGQSMPSNATFTVSSDYEAALASVEYKTFSVTYQGVADTSWYDEFKDGNEFVITTPADLYGLAEIVNNGTTLVDKVIYLGADIVINQGIASAEGWEPATGTTTYPWNPIGIVSGKRFNGTFEGQGNTISGIYMSVEDTTTNYYGLFGITGEKSVLTNFKLVNSYYESKNEITTADEGYAFMGSVAGQIAGDLDTVYSEAILVSVNRMVGGLVGRTNPGGDSTTGKALTINNCQFAGEAYMTRPTEVAYDFYLGGIVGDALQGNVTISNTLVTGTVTGTYLEGNDSAAYGINIGGIIGGFLTQKVNVTISKCLVTGRVSMWDGNAETEGAASTEVTNQSGVCSLFGYVNSANVVINLENAIATTESASKGLYQKGANTTINGTSSGYKKAEADITGYISYDTASVLGFYSDSVPENKWVVVEEGMPALESFTDHWIDLKWYYDSPNATSFTINTEEELYGFSVISSNVDAFKGQTVCLGDDIEVNSGLASVWASGAATPDRTFTPIGLLAAFQGTFDGRGNTISGIYIDTPGQKNGVGLFASVSGKVQNLRLENSYIRNVIEEKNQYVGSIVGFLSGTMDNVYSDAIIYSSYDGTVDAATYADDDNVFGETGGLVGRFGGAYDVNGDTTLAITNSWYAGSLTTTEWRAGGIVGRSERGNGLKSVENCLFTGSINSTYAGIDGEKTISYVGGIIGLADSSNLKEGFAVKNCVVIGDITSVCTNSTAAFVGRARRPLIVENAYTNIVMADSGWLQTNAVPGVGANSVNGSSQNVTGEAIELATSELVGTNAYIYTELDFYSSDNTDGVWAVVDGSTPVLKNLYDGAVVADLDDLQRISTGWYYNNKYREDGVVDKTVTYNIANEADFYGLAKIVNDGYNFEGKTVELIASLDMNPGWTASETAPANKWAPIAKNSTTAFNGTFDGNMNTIKGIYVNETTAGNSGLFGYTGPNSLVQGIRIENSYYTSDKVNMGSIVGVLKGSIKDCYSSADIVTTGNQAGGIFAQFDRGTDVTNGVTVSNCWFDGTITSSGIYCGGVIGRLYKGKIAIDNILNTGTVTSSYKTDYWGWVGGLIGGIESGTGNTALYVDLSDSVSAGKVYVNCGTGGSVWGRSQRATVTVKNVYTENHLEKYSDSSAEFNFDYGMTGTGRYSVSNCAETGVPVAMTDKLHGDNAYVFTELDFYTTDNADGLWVTVDGDNPVLKSFVEASAKDYSKVQRKATGWYYNAFTWKSADNVSTNKTTSYTITKADDMWGLAELVNAGTQSFSGLTVKLGNDIVLNGGSATDWKAGTNRPVNSWIPIGTVTGITAQFKGTFDGANHTLSGLYMVEDTANAGLFGAVYNPTIKNLRFTNSYLEYNGTSTWAKLGAIIGYGDGTLDNIYTDAILVSNARAVGGLVGHVLRAGGAGSSALYITNSWFNGTIDASYQNRTTDSMHVGGFVGWPEYGTTTLDACLYTGDMVCNYMAATAQTGCNARVGGLVGSDGDSSKGIVEIADSIAAGTIHFNWYNNPNASSSSMNLNDACDIIGVVYNTNSKTEGTVLALTDITKWYEVGNKTVEGTKTWHKSAATDANFACISNEWDDAIDAEDSKESNLYQFGAYILTDLPFEKVSDDDATIWVSRQSTLPIPSTLTDVVDDEMLLADYVDTSWYTGDKTEYEIADVKDLYGLSKLSYTNTFDGITFKVTNNITVNSGDASTWADKPAKLQWYPINIRENCKFGGVFDGQGHTISGLYSKLHFEYIGMFAFTKGGSAVKNLRLVNSCISEANAGTDSYVGSVISDNQGVMDNIYSNAYVVSDANQMGGLVARINTNKMDTTDSENYTLYYYSSGKTFAYPTTPSMTNCWFDGVVDMGDTGRYGGGLVSTVVQGGLNMSNCLFTGEIKADYNEESNVYIGGIIGQTMSNQGQNITLESVISAGTITGEHNDLAVGSVVGMYRNGVLNNNTKYAYGANPVITMTNVFATRDCYEVPYGQNGATTGTLIITPAVEDDPETDADETVAAVTEVVTSTISITGTVLQTTGEDRLIGYGTQEITNADGSAMVLDFASNWTMRTDAVPVPTALKDMATNIIATPSVTAMAKEVGLDYWNANAAITDAIASGGGNYLVTYPTSNSLTYDGYVEKLVGLGYTKYADNAASDMDTDGVVASTYYKAATETTGEWVINITYVANESKIYISINTDVNSMDDNLVGATSEGSAAISLSLIELVNESRYGNSFAFQLPNGHFIVNDGGMLADAGALVTYLKEQATAAGTDKVYIDAWIITHYHGDHAGAISAFTTNKSLREGIVLEAVYASEPSMYALTSWNESQVGTINNALRGAMTLSRADGGMPEVYQMHMGQRYYFNGITVDVIDTQEQHHTSTWGTYSDPDKYNSTSTNCVYTFADKSGATKKVLLGGDSTNVNMRYIMKAYAAGNKTLSNINVFAPYHHGKNTTCTYASGTVDGYAIYSTATKDWANYLLANTNNPSGFKFDAILFPYHQVFDSKPYAYHEPTGQSNVYGGDDGSLVFPYNISEINQYFIDNANAYFTYGYEDEYAATNEESHGTVKITFDGNNTATVYESKIAND